MIFPGTKKYTDNEYLKGGVRYYADCLSFNVYLRIIEGDKMS